MGSYKPCRPSGQNDAVARVLERLILSTDNNNGIVVRMMLSGGRCWGWEVENSGGAGEVRGVGGVSEVVL